MDPLALDAECENLLRRFALEVEDLTLEQLAEALRQAICSGDFQRHIVTTPILVAPPGETPRGLQIPPQGVTYLPYREKLRMQERIQELELLMTRLAGGLEVCLRSRVGASPEGLAVLVRETIRQLWAAVGLEEKV